MLFSAIYYYLLLFTAVYCCLLLLTAIYCYLLLFIALCNCSLPFTTSCFHLLLFYFSNYFVLLFSYCLFSTCYVVFITLIFPLSSLLKLLFLLISSANFVITALFRQWPILQLPILAILGYLR